MSSRLPEHLTRRRTPAEWRDLALEAVADLQAVGVKLEASEGVLALLSFALQRGHDIGCTECAGIVAAHAAIPQHHRIKAKA